MRYFAALFAAIASLSFQDGIELKTLDGAGQSQVRMSVESGANTASITVKKARLRFDPSGSFNLRGAGRENPSEGDLSYDDRTGQIQYRDGRDSWVPLASRSGPSPVAWASVEANGSILKSSPNLAVGYDFKRAAYFITVKDLPFVAGATLVVVTVRDEWSNHYVPTTRIVDETLEVSLRDFAGKKGQNKFDIVVYRP